MHTLHSFWNGGWRVTGRCLKGEVPRCIPMGRHSLGLTPHGELVETVLHVCGLS